MYLLQVMKVVALARTIKQNKEASPFLHCRKVMALVMTM
jgi:hypothetical protein